MTSPPPPRTDRGQTRRLLLWSIVFAIVLLLSRYVSLASIVSAASVPLFFRYLLNDAPFWHIVISIGISIAVILKHHSNIARLAQGTERKLGQKKETT